MSTAEELVSIIVPVHNAGAYIEKTIETVKAQTYSRWELILVDDCSTDDSRQKIRSFVQENDSQIRLIEKTCNEGAARA